MKSDVGEEDQAGDAGKKAKNGAGPPPVLAEVRLREEAKASRHLAAIRRKAVSMGVAVVPFSVGESLYGDTPAVEEERYDGDDLEHIREKWLTKKLHNKNADDPVALAKQKVKLHEAAQGGAGADSKLAAAHAQVDQVRKALRDNDKEIKVLIKVLVSLALNHFPEFLSHEEVKAFMGSGGLKVRNRQLSDYDDRQTLMIERSRLLKAKLNGVVVALKKFPLHLDQSEAVPIEHRLTSDRERNSAPKAARAVQSVPNYAP